ncbi:hypothetical protein EG329_012604 [Mollisiaceae sp. DMI_Dod_QoI]|nr:hypothetical protein EG329_012604 [Helotiales sp. DMI_Dod_QoI]
MCRYIVTSHTYSDCRFRKENLDETPNSFFDVFRRIIPNWNQIRGEQTDPPVDRGPHLVKERRIIQCQKAVNDPAHSQIEPAQRKCLDPEPAIPEDETAVPGGTARRGVCRVCQAAEDALDETVVIPIEQAPTAVAEGAVGAKGTRKRKHNHDRSR